MKEKSFVLLVLFLLFEVDIKFLPYWTWCFGIIGLIAIFNEDFIKKYGLFRKSYLLIYLIWIVMLIWSLISIAINKSFEFSYIKRVFLIGSYILRGFGLLFIFEKAFKEKAKMDLFLHLFIKACDTFVICTLVFILFPPIKNFWFENIINFDVSEIIWNQSIYTYRIGINGFCAFTTAVIFSVALLFKTKELVISFKNNGKYFWGIVEYFLIVLGCFLYGRVTIIAILLSVAYLIFFLSKNTRILKIILCSGILIFVFFQGMVYLSKSNDQIEIWLKWAFEWYFSFIETGKFSTASTNQVFNSMIFIPSMHSFLLGDGVYTLNGSYYMSTDVGFMRLILFYGIFGACLNYLLVLIPVFSSYSMLKKKKDLSSTVLIVCIFVLFLLLEIKGEGAQIIMFCILPILSFNYKEQRCLIVRNCH